MTGNAYDAPRVTKQKAVLARLKAKLQAETQATQALRIRVHEMTGEESRLSKAANHMSAAAIHRQRCKGVFTARYYGDDKEIQTGDPDKPGVLHLFNFFFFFVIRNFASHVTHDQGFR